MEEGAHSLSNDDLLRLISFLENPQAGGGFAPQSAVRFDPLYSAASQVPFPLSALPPQQGTPVHPSAQPFPTPYHAPQSGYNPHLTGMLTPAMMQTPVMMQAPPSRVAPHPHQIQLEQQLLAQQQVQLAHLPSPYPAAAEQPLSPPESAAPQILGELQQLQLKQREQLEKMRAIQKQLIMMPQKEGLEMLDAQQKQLRLQVEHELKGLQQLHSSVLLEPADIQRLSALQTELRMQLMQCELFRQELQQLVQPHMQKRCIAALFLLEQPFPIVITKGKTLDDDPVVVQLLTGAALEFSSISKVKATVQLDIVHQAKPSTNPPRFLEADLQAMDAYRRQSKWHMKFLVGSRKHAITIRFSMIVQVGQAAAAQSATIESEASNPWVVITNECQWEEAEGLLIRKEAFTEQENVPWISFANILHRHFLRATRQDMLRPQRPLSAHDIQYLHQKGFGGTPFVSAKMFDQFWLWYGKVLQKLRYQRHIGQLWQTGLLHGFLMREEVEALLRNEEVGTFLIRFSERHAGLFAVGYKVDDPDPAKTVRHYLIRPEDLAGTKKTLPDFLAEQAAFVNVLQDPIFEQYYSKRNTISNVNGYDDRVTRGRTTEDDGGGDGGDDEGDGEGEEELYMN